MARRIDLRHTTYGCETGCCGIQPQDAETGEYVGRFDFFHLESAEEARSRLETLSVELGEDLELGEWDRGCY